MKNLRRLTTAIRLQCPHCQQGRLFKSAFWMNVECPKCGLKFEPEPGFYLGSVYANYGATALSATVAFLILVYGYGFNKDVVIWSCTAFTTLFPLWFFRYARSIWLSLMYMVSSSDFNQPRSASEYPI